MYTAAGPVLCRDCSVGAGQAMASLDSNEALLAK